MVEGAGTCSTLRTAQVREGADAAIATAAMSTSRPIRRRAEGIHPTMQLAQDRRVGENSHMPIRS